MNEIKIMTDSRPFEPILLLTVWVIFLFLPLPRAQADETERPRSSQVKALGSKPKKLNLQDCIDLALRNNHARAVSRYGLEIAEAQHQQALSAYWPQVGAKAVYSVMDEDPNFIFPGRIISLQGMSIPANTPNGQIQLSSLPVPEQNVKLMDKKNFVASLNATLPLYTGGKTTSIVRQTEQGILAAREESRRTDLQIVYDTTRYYYGVVLAKELFRIGRDTLARMEVTLALTERLYTTGSGSVKKTDYLRNKTVVEWLRSAVSSLEANEKLAKAALTNGLGLSWDTRVETADEGLPFSPVGIEIRDLVSGAYRFSPDWHRMAAGLAAAEAKISEAQSGHLPTIALFGNLTRIENSYDKGLVTPENKNSWTIGIGLELPLFNGLRTTNEVREARARLLLLKEQQVLLREGIALQIQHVFIQLMRSQDQKTSTEAAAVSAEENRLLNERAYREDLVETKDVIEAQLTESLMKALYKKTLYDHLEARANLDFVVGKEVSALLDNPSCP